MNSEPRSQTGVQLTLIPLLSETQRLSLSTDSTFVDNMRRPVHRWFRYSAGYAGDWVEAILRDSFSGEGTVFDPFCGSGTTLVAADRCGVHSVGIEAHPFVSRIAAAKLAWSSDTTAFQERSRAVLAGGASGALDAYPALIRACYPDATLLELSALAEGWRATDDGGPASALCWLALTSCLRSCSPVGTSNMELIQPKKEKKGVQHPRTAFQQAVMQILADMRAFAACGARSRSRLLIGDARGCAEVNADSIDLVVTSPPYANNFDYADALRLEMTFWGEVSSWADLHGAVRKHLLVSCAQHATADRLDVEEVLSRACTRPIHRELSEVVRELGEVRLERGGKKHYHTMIAAYFADMAVVWKELARRIGTRGGLYFVRLREDARPEREMEESKAPRPPR